MVKVIRNNDAYIVVFEKIESKEIDVLNACLHLEKEQEMNKQKFHQTTFTDLLNAQEEKIGTSEKVTPEASEADPDELEIPFENNTGHVTISQSEKNTTSKPAILAEKEESKIAEEQKASKETAKTLPETIQKPVAFQRRHPKPDTAVSDHPVIADTSAEKEPDLAHEIPDHPFTKPAAFQRRKPKVENDPANTGNSVVQNVAGVEDPPKDSDKPFAFRRRTLKNPEADKSSDLAVNAKTEEKRTDRPESEKQSSPFKKQIRSLEEVVKVTEDILRTKQTPPADTDLPFGDSRTVSVAG